MRDIFLDTNFPGWVILPQSYLLFNYSQIRTNPYVIWVLSFSNNYGTTTGI
ncbi:hypothetical protein ALE3EI_2600 [Constantimarinum furrinae]|uniref:Uncharacterized protein n=1 Tax=Constantimarinum furrinae TaxID=2562285 RepID=A0A7G8PXR3_9FLAO|nr:hypothetical protein ALE3EI_2600 [Constantimarinum furrinae]